MANRSYLYSSNIEPIASSSLILTGLSEWNNEVPLLYRVLFSGGMALQCKSLIFDIEEFSAIYIDYLVALENFEKFRDIVSKYYASSVFGSSIEFLLQDRNRGKYLVLEPYEIYLLDDGNVSAKQDALLAELKNTSIEENAKYLIDSCIDKKRGLISSILNKSKNEAFDKLLCGCGFAEWSNVLCYAPYPPPQEKFINRKESEEIVCFELENLNSFAWFKRIEINRRSKEVLLKEHRNKREYKTKLVDENQDINDRLNFRFTIYPENRGGYIHVFSLLKGPNPEENCWRLSSSSLENKHGEITLRGVSETFVYVLK